MEGLSGQLKNVSEKINIRNFLKQWDSTAHVWLESDQVDTITRIAEEMDVPLDTVEELDSVCGIDTLKRGDEPAGVEILQNIPDDLDLVTARFQRRELQKREESTLYRNNIIRKMKYRFSDDKLGSGYQDYIKNKETIPASVKINQPEVLIKVCVHVPCQITPQMQSVKIVLDQTYLVLGSQKLTELRDKITCVNDFAVAGDLSENPDDVTRYYAKDIYKSGFFYFEGVFYNDMREPDCRDYSEVIRKWAENPANRAGPYQSEKMENTTFLDLNVRLGYPYVYQHQGNCEHIIVISDVRWMVYNSEYAPENPCFMCDQCFKALHYDKDDCKIGDFQAYRYFDSHAVI
ncbi:hypothetical protein KUTeg_022589 [Tegillarca granosa]|uniref:snRNA-activating protein complex subunit 3 n=1 Tax=Tegillarca granosa TaxID=220873 RepID=A0ABQ9E3J0_TEGGR|nr:hypothetical protein KUTeg_022589 [Tegillarca granosa]